MNLNDAIIRSAVLVILASVTVTMCLAFPNAASDPRTGMVMRLPEYKVGHHVMKVGVTEEEKVWLPPDTEILKRAYIPRGVGSPEEAWRKAILATLILSGTDQRSLHRPQVCLDSQGWEVEKQEVAPLVVNGKPLEVTDLHLLRLDRQRDGSLKRVRAHYVYWWVGKDRTTPSTLWRSVYSVWDNMVHNRNSRWGYPSVHTTVLEELGEDGRAEAQERAYDFIRTHAPLFQKSLRDE